jgi:hypothetical protein
MDRARQYKRFEVVHVHQVLHQVIEVHLLGLIWKCVDLVGSFVAGKTCLTYLIELIERIQDQVSRVANGGGIRLIRLFVLVLLAPLLLLDPFSTSLALTIIVWETRPTLFRLSHHKAATPRMIRATTTGPAITPGLIDLPLELEGLGIHSI